MSEQLQRILCVAFVAAVLALSLCAVFEFVMAQVQQ